MWGAPGGKNEPQQKKLQDISKEISTQSGNTKPSLIDKILSSENKETIGETALRECCEELYPQKNYPDEFSKEDFQNIYRLYGNFYDKLDDPKMSSIYVHVCEFKNKDFGYVGSREIEDLQPLEEILRTVPESEILPVTRLALNTFKMQLQSELYSDVKELKNYRNKNIASQIPIFELTPEESSCNNGVPRYFADSMVRIMLEHKV
jgi:hypothetical protein